MIYLDNAATTQPKQEVIDAMMPYFIGKWQNPSSLYSSAAKIKKDIENARETVGKFINAKGNEIFFTSSGSESNCWVLQGFVNRCHRLNLFPTIIISRIEHKSILSCVENIDADVYYVDVDNKGYIKKDNLEYILKFVTSETYQNKAILVSLQFANNEIGTIQNIKELADLSHKYNAVFHTDATQAFGAIPIDVTKLGVDMLSASGHKISAPKGIAILYKKKDVQIDPLIYGSQMDGLRGGTENVPYIIGFAKAVELINVNKKDALKNNKTVFLRNYFINKLMNTFDCKINGSTYDRLANNINVTFKDNITGEALIYMLDMADVCISAGSACNSHTVEPSYVLKAIGLTDEEAYKTIRISISEELTTQEIDKVIFEIDRQIKVLTV